MDSGDNWKCRYCGHAQVIADKRISKGWQTRWVEGWKEDGFHPGLYIEAIVCANNDCRELSLSMMLARYHPNSEQYVAPVQTWRLLPASSARPQPNFIPAPLRDDYYEACAIRDLSPKASATIIRRCLQGMIRDFCGISKHRLVDEIKELRERVHASKGPAGVLPDSVQAIDHVRGIGNIGAHMEADINVIVDVDSNEAQVLIGLTELLFREWYVARETRKAAFADLKKIAEDKQEQKKLPPPEEPAGS